MPLYLEDLRAGDRFRSGSATLTEESLLAFARNFDPQPFHLDPGAARKSPLRGLAASGWHTAALTMRLMVSGEARFAGGCIGLGVDALRWLRPVRPGDVLSVETEILEVRPSRSKPGRGVVRARNTTYNQRGEAVQTCEAVMLLKGRAAGEAADG